MDWDEDDGGPAEEESASEGETAPCPHCSADIYEDAERCPACGMYLSSEDAPRAGWPAWMWIAAALALVVCALMAGVQMLPWLFR